MIRLQREDFDIGAEVDAVIGGRTDIGAVVTFTGLVRDMGGGRAGAALTLEHYPAMAMRAPRQIEHEATSRWALEGSLVIHGFGRLLAGERIVRVVTASPHRSEAF